MSLHALVDLICPHCHRQFSENAKLVRPGAKAWCPECEQLFALDETNAAMRKVLDAAKAARRRRKERLKAIKRGWAEMAPQAATPADTPRTLTEVLAVLDGLLERLDDRRDDRAA
jgi:predicted amidophosphoribosyltransferase